MGSSRIDNLEGESALTAIVALTEQMVECARRGDWDRLLQMELTRKTLLEGFFAPGAEQVRAPYVAPCLQRLAALNRELLELSTKAQKEVAAKLDELQRGQRARDAYDRNR